MIHKGGTEKNLEGAGGAVLSRRMLLLGAGAAALVASCKPIELPPPETTKGTETPSSAETSPAAWPDTASPSSSAETSKITLESLTLDNLPKAMDKLDRDEIKTLEEFLAIGQFIANLTPDQFKELDRATQQRAMAVFFYGSKTFGKTDNVFFDENQSVVENLRVNADDPPEEIARKIEMIIQLIHSNAYLGGEGEHRKSVMAFVAPGEGVPFDKNRPLDTDNGVMLAILESLGKSNPNSIVQQVMKAAGQEAPTLLEATLSESANVEGGYVISYRYGNDELFFDRVVAFTTNSDGVTTFVGMGVGRLGGRDSAALTK